MSDLFKKFIAILIICSKLKGNFYCWFRPNTLYRANVFLLNKLQLNMILPRTIITQIFLMVFRDFREQRNSAKCEMGYQVRIFIEKS